MKYFLMTLCTALFLMSCKKDDDVSPPSMDVGQQDPATNQGRVPCEGGFADGFPCGDYDLMSRVTLSEMNAEGGNDCWGWTDPSSGMEYAIMGLGNGTAFINVSNPEQPVYLGKLPTATVDSPWRDIKVYQNHAFIVSEALEHGLQVFDLTQLRNVTSPKAFSAFTVLEDFGSAHNIVINEDTGFAYVVGTKSTFNGGLHIVDIRNPKNPITVGGFGGDGYTHDAQAVVYDGPDPDYFGREIVAASNENTVTLVDVTNKDNPVLISKISYTNPGYTHQGWFTPDHRYFVANDELDERDFGFRTRTLLFDFEDLDNPRVMGTYLGSTNAIDHNHYINGNLLSMSNYNAGVRFLSTTDIANGTLEEIGFFDTHPENNITDFKGSWSNYPFFESGNIVISDINRGLFIVRRSGT
ncbi:MAG: choice-of-anchor B family protein [Leeuwenhoekiella sp.]